MRKSASVGPKSARWTHIALPTRDLSMAVEWWQSWTPLTRIHQRSDSEGSTAWLGHDDQPDHPFVLVLIEKAGGSGEVVTTLAPLAHIGIELPNRSEVDAVAARAETHGNLHWSAADLGSPVGYICAVLDPDGNVVEFSHGQGVYAAAREVSTSRPR